MSMLSKLPCLSLQVRQGAPRHLVGPAALQGRLREPHPRQRVDIDAEAHHPDSQLPALPQTEVGRYGSG